MFDPELPNGCQDADFEMAELQEAADRETRLERRGICTHGHRQGYNGQPDMTIGQVKCLSCGIIFADEAAIETARQEALC